MMFRGALFLIGFGLAVLGGISLIGYLNLMTMGMSLFEYIGFVIKRPESYFLPLGIFLVTFTLFCPDRKTNDSD
ncbi:hypothetical protein MUB24_05430 [Lederbergia sp. NSJ-179]|uniref:hypothetical protein n=1 Tax=Lederbergia sp. NSJ-179 TaxID=2931402 RepID=UPI001FD5E058|nr:hypothetical protein [Lederbergia sp. NSJ-179]MCJ7840366.1 hypothetical protein [Lederbergia sp. NSJ-179]